MGIRSTQDRSINGDQGGKRKAGFITVVLSELGACQQEIVLSVSHRRESPENKPGRVHSNKPEMGLTAREDIRDHLRPLCSEHNEKNFFPEPISSWGFLHPLSLEIQVNSSSHRKDNSAALAQTHP